jgi:RING finger/CHY zinc finger protein 1
MADAASATSNTGSTRSSSETIKDEKRRKHIREIMVNPKLSATEKSKAVQSLMDGRRRSSLGTTASAATNSSSREGDPVSYVSNMARVAAAAAEYYSDEEGDAVMSEGHGEDDCPDDISYGYDDVRSVASSVTHTSRLSESGFPLHQVAPGSYRHFHGRSFSLQDWNDTSRAAVAANTSIFAEHPTQVSRLMEQSRPKCHHYDRNCTLISPCCGLAFGCRICHEECPVLPPPLQQWSQRKIVAVAEVAATIAKKSKLERRRSMPLDLEDADDEETHHAFDRFAVRELICRQCYLRQSSKTYVSVRNRAVIAGPIDLTSNFRHVHFSNNCVNCGIQFGLYHCNICNLWMSDAERPYHCQDCGFCRVGGRESFRHCHDCGMCIDAQLFDEHNCKAGKYMSNCPVCQEDLFSSRHASHEMPCGHAIHWHCFKELTTYDSRCPVCKKTAETPEEMAATWSAIAMGIALQPVPPEMARIVNIVCNDCENRDHTRRWHFLGVRCHTCMSFNTVVQQTVMNGIDAAALLDQLDAQAQAVGVPSNISLPVAPPSIPAPMDGVAIAPNETHLERPRHSNSMEEEAPSADEYSEANNNFSANDLANEFRRLR